MASIVWNRSPQEAYKNPYEYAIQEQFVREATALLQKFNKALQKYSMKFRKNDYSVKKAIWMLQLDALDSLRDALEALKIKKHRIAGKLFRDVMETLDIAAYFYAQTEKSKKNLKKWYKNEIISHSEYRDYVEKTLGQEISEAKKQEYKNLSQFTHRSYRALLDGYGLGRDDLIWHDGVSNNGFMVLPQTIAAYYATLASLIKEFNEEVVKRGLLNKKEVKEIVNSSLETEVVPRRWAS